MMGYSFFDNPICVSLQNNLIKPDGSLSSIIPLDSKKRPTAWYNCIFKAIPKGSPEDNCDSNSFVNARTHYLPQNVYCCLLRGETISKYGGKKRDLMIYFKSDNMNAIKIHLYSANMLITDNKYQYRDGGEITSYCNKLNKNTTPFKYEKYKKTVDLLDGTIFSVYYDTSFEHDQEYINSVYDVLNRTEYNYFNNGNKASIPIFDFSDGESIKKYIESGDRSGEIVAKGTDWSVYVDGKKNPLLHIYWKNKWFEKELLKDMTPDMMTTKIWSEVPIIDNGVETGEFKKISLYSGSYRPHPFDTSFKSIFKKVDPKAYNSLLDGLLNPLETRRYKICMRNEYWEKTTGQKRYTDTAFFYIDNHGEVLSSGIIEDTEPDESTITIKFGAGINPDDTYKPIPDGSDVKDGDTASGNGSNNLGLLTTTYKLTAARLKGLGGFLWGGLIDSIKLVNNNPIENIVSCKIIPVATGGTDKNIYLGNVNTNIMGEVITGHKKVTLGNIPVSEFYGSFLDYAPFTKISIFIPFIGFKELDTSLYMGKNISVEYIVDMITGSCKALLYANGIYCQSYDGNCGIDIPLTSNNRAQVEAAYIGGAIGTVGEIAGKDVLGALDSMLNTAVTPYHYNTSGTYSPTCGSFETRLCYLIIDRPTFQLPTSYGHDRGYPCELSRSIGSVSGFTVVDSGVDLSGISCTDNERDIIRTLLTSGFYA